MDIKRSFGNSIMQSHALSAWNVCLPKQNRIRIPTSSIDYSISLKTKHRSPLLCKLLCMGGPIASKVLINTEMQTYMRLIKETSDSCKKK